MPDDNMIVPWGVHRLRQVFARRDRTEAGLPDGTVGTAVYEPYDSIRFRVVGAWWVLTGRAHAFIWPKPGELEFTLYPEGGRDAR